MLFFFSGGISQFLKSIQLTLWELNLFPTPLERGIGFSTWRNPEAGLNRVGGARRKMAFVRCRRDPCGVICLVLTYFSVFYADYVVVQYVLIPAYSDRSVLGVLTSLEPFKNGHGGRFSIQLTVGLTAPRAPFSPLYWYATRVFMTSARIYVCSCGCL